MKADVLVFVSCFYESNLDWVLVTDRMALTPRGSVRYTLKPPVSRSTASEGRDSTVW